jgi:hypothetical protein
MSGMNQPNTKTAEAAAIVQLVSLRKDFVEEGEIGNVFPGEGRRLKKSGC